MNRDQEEKKNGTKKNKIMRVCFFTGTILIGLVFSSLAQFRYQADRRRNQQWPCDDE